ncbi:hypothetical protein F4805DRAFT_451728 [Annulohypoxylon moriforme]|nr:hypothetical protein F4805DRAFT_451728 [Annulohypoxylon moriforme]
MVIRRFVIMMHPFIPLICRGLFQFSWPWNTPLSLFVYYLHKIFLHYYDFYDLISRTYVLFLLLFHLPLFITQ